MLELPMNYPFKIFQDCLLEIVRIIIDIQYILEKLFSVWVFLAAANHK